ncbi:MAG: SIMPL domain-containing protein [Vicinamibacterales bacterium]
MIGWLAACLCLAAATQASAQDAAAPPTVVARGQGEVHAAPDMAYISLGAEQNAPQPAAAQAAVARAMTAVQQRLAGAGVPKDAIRTTTYDVSPRFDYVDGRQVPRGFTARHVIDVRVDELPKVGELLALALEAGGTSVQGVRFELKERQALEREALSRAVADARARADAMAAGAGSAVVGVVRIDEAGTSAPPPEPVMMRMAAAQAAPPPPPVAPGEIVIRASVTLTARLR